jgi:hypothetical protein
MTEVLVLVRGLSDWRNFSGFWGNLNGNWPLRVRGNYMLDVQMYCTT